MCEHHTHLPTSTEPESLDLNKLRELLIKEDATPAQITSSALPSNKQAQPKGQLKKFEPSRSPQIPSSNSEPTRSSEQPQEIKVNEPPTKTKLIQTPQTETYTDEQRKNIQERIQILLNMKGTVPEKRFKENAMKSLAQVLQIKTDIPAIFIASARQKISELFSSQEEVTKINTSLGQLFHSKNYLRQKRR